MIRTANTPSAAVLPEWQKYSNKLLPKKCFCNVFSRIRAFSFDFFHFTCDKDNACAAAITEPYDSVNEVQRKVFKFENFQISIKSKILNRLFAGAK